MSVFPESQAREEAAYRRLKDVIAQTYPHGRFVAIANEQVVADAANLQALDAQLRSLGLDPRATFVVQAGVDYLEYAHLLL
jgi:hypothetical protein